MGRLPARLLSSPSSVQAARLWMIAAILLWSTSGLFVKAPIFADWPEASRGALLAFWRAVFASAVLFPLVRRPRFRRELVPLSLCFTAMCLTYLTAMSLTTAANTIWLQSTAPLWVFLLGLIFLRERIAGRDAVPLVFGMAGIGVILLFESFYVEAATAAGVACGLVSGILYAVVVMLSRHLRDENPVWLVALNHAVAALVLLPWVAFQGIWPSPWQLVVLACFGALQMALPWVFVTRALRGLPSQEAVGIGLIEPLLVPTWVYLAWGEVPAWWTLVGGGLILVGLAARYFLLESPQPPVIEEEPLLPEPAAEQ